MDILLGVDHPHLLAVLESRVGGKDEPFASRTKLGWIVRGLLGGDCNPTTARAYHLNGPEKFMEGRTPSDSLASEFRQFCDTEAFGTEFQGIGLSESEQKAEQITNEGIKRLTVGYEAPFTWKDGEPAFFNNRPLAEHRLRSLLRHFDENPDFEQDYRAAIQKYVDEGYVSLVNDTDTASDDQYYLPHHGVYKKSCGRKGKLRVVFDAAARWKGRSLNDGMHRGRKLQADLPKILIRFQLGKVAYSSDITAMYSRIRLQPRDARYNRFLWQDQGSNTILTYQMNRLPFGANCSPFLARRLSIGQLPTPTKAEKIVSTQLPDTCTWTTY